MGLVQDYNQPTPYPCLRHIRTCDRGAGGAIQEGTHHWEQHPSRN